VIEADLVAYHAAGWQLGGMIFSTSDLEFPMVDSTTIVCFESHLIVGLGQSQQVSCFYSEFP
jgi:hypothetical protein